MKSIKNTVKEIIAGSINAGYENAREVTKVQIFHLLEKVLIDAVQRRRLGTHLIRQIDKLVEP